MDTRAAFPVTEATPAPSSSGVVSSYRTSIIWKSDIAVISPCFLWRAVPLLGRSAHNAAEFSPQDMQETASEPCYDLVQ